MIRKVRRKSWKHKQKIVKRIPRQNGDPNGSEGKKILGIQSENCLEDSSTERDPNDSECKKKIRGTEEENKKRRDRKKLERKIRIYEYTANEEPVRIQYKCLVPI
jgi:hypothetical protein